jgi:hypothetical protein
MEMRENPPTEPQFNKLIRTIAANEPRVTKFKINWESSAAAAAAAAAAATTSNVENGQEAGAATSGMETSQQPGLFQSSNSNQMQSQANAHNVTPPDAMDNKFENKENILLQQKAFNSNESKLAETAAVQNPLVENSFDSIMS